MSALGRIEDLRFVVTLKAGQYSPSELRAAFAQAIREAVMRTALDGRIEAHVGEELLRVIPAPERA